MLSTYSVGGYYPAPLALLLVFAARRILLPWGQLWFVPWRFQPCLTNLPTVKRPFHVGWFCSRVSVLNNICFDRVWFGSMSMYSSWKRQLLRVVSQRLSNCPSSRFCVQTLHNPNVNMCPFAESSFWYQALQLFLSHIIRRQMLANLTVNKLSYSAIAKQKTTCVIGNNVLNVLRLDVSLRLALVSPYA